VDRVATRSLPENQIHQNPKETSGDDRRMSGHQIGVVRFHQEKVVAEEVPSLSLIRIRERKKEWFADGSDSKARLATVPADAVEVGQRFQLVC
jgi:hypothetical protein